MKENQILELTSESNESSDYKVSLHENDSFEDFPIAASELDHFILVHKQKRYIDVDLLSELQNKDIQRLVKMVKQAQVIDISPEQILGYLSIFDQKILAVAIQVIGIKQTTSFKIDKLISKVIEVDLLSISRFFQYYKQQIKKEQCLVGLDNIQNWMIPNLFRFEPLVEISNKWRVVEFTGFTQQQMEEYINNIK